MADKTSPRAHEDRRFARAVIAEVRHALDTNRIRGFYLAAPPAFLGLLRDALDDHLRKALRNDLAKNLAGAPHGRSSPPSPSPLWSSSPPHPEAGVYQRGQGRTQG